MSARHPEELHFLDGGGANDNYDNTAAATETAAMMNNDKE